MSHALHLFKDLWCDRQLRPSLDISRLCSCTLISPLELASLTVNPLLGMSFVIWVG